MKFGGSSVGSPETIKRVAGIVKSQIRSGPIVVVSALSGATDSLIEIANTIAAGKSPEESLNSLIKRHKDTISELGLDQSIIENELTELKSAVEHADRAKASAPIFLDALASFGERLSARIVAGCMRECGIDATAYDAYDIGMLTDSNYGFADVLSETFSSIRKGLNGKPGVPVVTGFIGKDR
ncbi:MAG: hypothetical protein QXF01_02340, partial [Candidatus Micrarchaeaceae archaeon]